MVWLETKGEKNHKYRGIMIDGYCPDSNSLRDLEWKVMAREGYISKGVRWSKFYRALLPGTAHSEDQMLSTFVRLVDELESHFCPSSSKERREVCYYDWYSIGKNKRSLERYINNFPDHKIWKESLLTLTEEYDLDQERGRKNYVQWIAVQDLERDCGKLAECCQNWIYWTDFKVKQRKDYKGHEAFEAVWVRMLKDKIDRVNFYLP